MKFTAKLQDIAKAYFNRQVNVECNNILSKNPSMSKDEAHKKAKSNVISKWEKGYKTARNTTFGVLAGILFGALVIAGPTNATLRNTTVPVSYLTETQQYEIENLNDQDLQNFLEFEVNASQPTHLKGLTSNEKYAEITARTDEALEAFREYQDNLKKYMQAFDQHPDRFSEQTWLQAMETSNTLLGTYMKYDIVRQMYEHNATTADVSSKIYNIPDPSDVNFYLGSSSDSITQGLAVTSGPSGNMVNEGYIYISKDFFKGNIDKAIDTWFSNYDYINLAKERFSKDPNADSKKHSLTIINRIIGNNDAAEMVEHSKMLYKEHWTGGYSISFEDIEREQTRPQSQSHVGQVVEDNGPEL